MSTPRPELLLTRGERLAIAIAIPGIAVLVRLTIALLNYAFLDHFLRDELVAITITMAMFVLFPLAISEMVRAVAARRRGREIAVLVAFSILGAVTSYLWRWFVQPLWDLEFVWEFAWVHFRLYAPAVGVFLS